MFDESGLTNLTHLVTSINSMLKIKLLLRIKIYLVPNLENLTIRVLVMNVSHLYEMEIVGDLTVEKTIVAYVAYKEENGQLVPEVKFEGEMNNEHSDAVPLLSVVWYKSFDYNNNCPIVSHDNTTYSHCNLTY